MQQQRDDVESAVFNKGPYRLANSFRNFHLSETEWFKKRTEQRERHLEKFHRAKMSNEKESELISIDPDPGATVPRKVLAVNLLSANIRSLPAVTLQSIVKKAEELLNREGAITSAPGNNMAYMVESQTTTRPHFVELKKNGKVICDGCPSFASTKLCAQAIAASEKAGVLEKYIQWLTKNGPTTMNLTSLITFDSSKNTGKKSSKPSTARRKGSRGNKSRPVESIVDRPFHLRNSAQPHGSAQSSPSSETQLNTPQQTPQAQHSTPETSQGQHATLQTPQAQLSATQLSHQAMHVHCSAPQSHATQLHASRLQFLQQTLQVQQQPPQQPIRMAPPQLFTPQPSNGAFEVHLLQFCHVNVRSCFGCGQTLKPGDRIPDPPHDITIVSRMLRPFNHKTSGERMSKERNVYFHVHVGCIRSKQPYFQPSMVTVGTWVASQLTMQHVLLLRQFGMHI